MENKVLREGAIAWDYSRFDVCFGTGYSFGIEKS